MEANQRRRSPLSDCTNTCSSSSPLSLKSHKTSPTSSALNKPTGVDNPTNPTSPSPPIPSTPSVKTPSPHGIVDVDAEASEPISIVYSRRNSSRKRRREKGKAVAVTGSRTPDFNIFDNREKNVEFEGVNLPKAKALTVPRTKKQRVLSSEKDASKDLRRQDSIEKHKAYFKEIDEFELLVEAESGDD